MKLSAFALCSLLALPAFAAPAAAETMKMSAELKGGAEVPATTSAGTGTVDASYDTATKMLSWKGASMGMTGPATAAHFHGPAAPGANAGVMVPAKVAGDTFEGSAALTDAQAKALLAGEVYFNIHTAANPNGELRGQLAKAK